jgi:hypothetical protein
LYCFLILIFILIFWCAFVGGQVGTSHSVALLRLLVAQSRFARWAGQTKFKYLNLIRLSLLAESVIQLPQQHVWQYRCCSYGNRCSFALASLGKTLRMTVVTLQINEIMIHETCVDMDIGWRPDLWSLWKNWSPYKAMFPETKNSPYTIYYSRKRYWP